MYTDKEIRDYHKLVTRKFKAGTCTKRHPCRAYIPGGIRKDTEYHACLEIHKTGSKHVLRAGDTWYPTHLTTV